MSSHANTERALVYEDPDEYEPHASDNPDQGALEPEIVGRETVLGLGTDTLIFLGKNGLNDTQLVSPAEPETRPEVKEQAKEKDELDLTPDPDLSLTDKNSELILLVLLKDQKLTKREIVKLTGLSADHCTEALKNLNKTGFIEIELNDLVTKTMPSTPVSVLPKKIIRNYTEKCITPRVLSALAKQNDSPHIQELIRRKYKSMERQAKRPTGEAIFADLKPAIKQPKVEKNFRVGAKETSFIVIKDDSMFCEKYTTRQFAGFDPRFKVILAAHKAASFAKTAEELSEAVEKIVNKNVTKETKLSHSQIQDILQNCAANGYFESESWRHSPTVKAIKLLKAYHNHIKSRLKGFGEKPLTYN